MVCVRRVCGGRAIRSRGLGRVAFSRLGPPPTRRPSYSVVTLPALHSIMAAEISMRHFPDISDASLDQDFSESSFQIPSTGSPSDLLMDETSMDLLRNDPLSTPMAPNRAQPRNRAPLTLQNLTPRSTRTRATPARSSLRPRAPGIATPLRTIVAKNISEALSEDISSVPGQDLSFQIPTAAARQTDSLLDTHDTLIIPDCADITFHQLHSAEPEPAPLTLSQLRPQFNESLSEHASTSATLRTPEPASNEPQICSGNIDECKLGSQRAESIAIHGACQGNFTLEGGSPLSASPIICMYSCHTSGARNRAGWLYTT